MRDAVVQELVTVADEAVLGIHGRQVGLCINPTGVVAHLGQCRAQQPVGVALSAGVAFSAQPADPEDSPLL